MRLPFRSRNGVSHHWRMLLGLTALMIWLLAVIVARLWAANAPSVQQSYQFDKATLAFSVDHGWVWQSGDCVTLHWTSANIRGIYIQPQGGSPTPTIGVDTIPWCADQEVSIPYFTVDLTDGSVRYLAPLGVYPIRRSFLLSIMPLLILAGWTFRVYRPIVRVFDRLPRPIRRLFSASGTVSSPLVMLFILINVVVIWNAIYIRPWMGYDIEGHYANVIALSQGRLPTPQESGEFFSPPLAYVFPALIAHFTGATGDPIEKVGQLQNIAISLIAIFYLLRIGARLYPDDPWPRVVALLLLSILTVYYKTFAFMRGEPFVVMLTLFLFDYLLGLVDRKVRFYDPLVIGITGGLLLLSRQWSAFILGGAAFWWLVLLIRQRPIARRLLLPGLIAAVIAVLVGSWFYVDLAAQNGTILAFNRSPDTQPKSATFFTGLGNGHLFTYPYSPGYDGQVLPIFYTEIWGDYFGYFYLQRPPIASRMPASSLELMGGVNAVSLAPTLLLIGGMAFGLMTLIRPRRPAANNSTPTTDGSDAQLVVIHRADWLFSCAILVSIIGFGWFLIRYPTPDADTAKATYMLQIFPLICLLAGEWLSGLKYTHPRLFWIVIVGLLVVAAHNLPIWFTRIN